MYAVLHTITRLTITCNFCLIIDETSTLTQRQRQMDKIQCKMEAVTVLSVQCLAIQLRGWGVAS